MILDCVGVFAGSPLLLPSTKLESIGVLRLHNDVVNTFDKVISCLRQIDLPARVHQGLGMACNAGIGCSVPHSLGSFSCGRDGMQIDRERRSQVLLTWLLGLCKRMDGLARIVAVGLTSPFHLSRSTWTYEQGHDGVTPASHWRTPVV